MIGEAVHVITRDYKDKNKDDLLAELGLKLQKSEIEVCAVEENRLGELSNLLREVRSHERRIGTTDVIIVACCIVDQSCKGILTFDGDLIGSEGLTRLVQKHVIPRRHFRISDRVQTK